MQEMSVKSTENQLVLSTHVSRSTGALDAPHAADDQSCTCAPGQVMLYSWQVTCHARSSRVRNIHAALARYLQPRYNIKVPRSTINTMGQLSGLRSFIVRLCAFLSRAFGVQHFLLAELTAGQSAHALPSSANVSALIRRRRSVLSTLAFTNIDALWEHRRISIDVFVHRPRPRPRMSLQCTQ